MLRLVRGRLGGLLSALVGAALLVGMIPSFALAADNTDYNGDILIGTFFESDQHPTDTIYGSVDGTTFYALSQPYVSMGGNKAGQYEDGHWCAVDPSIMYHDGYYWMISGWNRNDGKIWVMISYSSDLVNWTHPEGTMFGGSYSGIAVNQKPSGSVAGFDMSKFDTVAPEWFVDSDGTPYIIVSCGYYGAFHGQPTTDKMQTYLVKVNQLSATGTPSNHSYPQGLVFKPGTAVKLNVNGDGADRIDGSIYKAGKTYYLTVKKDGLNNQIWSTTNINANNWSLVKDRATYGYEGPSMTSLNGTYFMYTDHVTGATADGVHVATSSSPTSSWSIQGVSFLSNDGKTRMAARHGTVIRISKSQQPEAWKAAARLLPSGIAARARGKVMYRLYNPNSGEHFYTANPAECDNVVAAGWNYEGIGWTAPVKSNTPVYRLYSGTDHHYTMSAGERDDLIKAGWKYEGVGWYSDDAKGVPLYRQFNPYVVPSAPRNNSGSHNYTTSKAENDHLVSVGWRAEGIGWYGMK